MRFALGILAVLLAIAVGVVEFRAITDPVVAQSISDGFAAHDPFPRLPWDYHVIFVLAFFCLFSSRRHCAIVRGSVICGADSTTSVTQGKALALYAPAPKIPPEVRARHLGGAGVCLVLVRPDGTVSHAEMLPSTGQPILDKVSTEAFSKWRFRPGTVNEVKIPIRYTGNYGRPSKTSNQGLRPTATPCTTCPSRD